MYHFSTSLGGTEMAKAKDAGVFKMENGLWAYRFAVMIDGKQVARRKSTDELGAELSEEVPPQNRQRGLSRILHQWAVRPGLSDHPQAGQSLG